MKKSFILFSLLIVPFLASCHESSIDMPKSPFVDYYKRIGMQGEYAKTNDMDPADYSAIKTYINNPKDYEKDDINVASYHRQDEVRDLKYAYFGQESSTISQCSMTSQSEDLKRYKNRVFIDTNITDRQIQTANGGIQKTKSVVSDYTYDDDYRESTPTYGNYSKINDTKINDEANKVTLTASGTYSSDDEIYNLFALKPYNSRIKKHFAEQPDPTTGYDFRLLANKNNAVYYVTTVDNEERYLIKEGYSLFSEFHTTMGRSYKAQDNYFYEGLLQKYEISEGVYSYRFTHFRFYHELLILSKAIDGEGVPVLYLDKPVLIEFSETTYSSIKYAPENSLEDYDGDIPTPTLIEE